MVLPSFADDLALLGWTARTLYSAVLSDACDAAGYRDRALGPDIRPLDETKVLVGRAKTVVWAPMFHVPERPYDKEIAAVDSLRAGEVFVMAVGRSREIVPWGELLSTAAMARGGLRTSTPEASAAYAAPRTAGPLPRTTTASYASQYAESVQDARSSTTMRVTSCPARPSARTRPAGCSALRARLSLRTAIR